MAQLRALRSRQNGPPPATAPTSPLAITPAAASSPLLSSSSGLVYIGPQAHPPGRPPKDSRAPPKSFSKWKKDHGSSAPTGAEAYRAYNASPRLKRLKEVEDQLKVAAEANAERLAKLEAAFVVVNQALKALGSEGPSEVTKKPLMEHLKDFIYKGDGYEARILAWKGYKRVHGFTEGKTVAYRYYLDFVHGGADKHATLLENKARPLVLSDDDLRPGATGKRAKTADSSTQEQEQTASGAGQEEGGYGVMIEM